MKNKVCVLQNLIIKLPILSYFYFFIILFYLISITVLNGFVLPTRRNLFVVLGNIVTSSQDFKPVRSSRKLGFQMSSFHCRKLTKPTHGLEFRGIFLTEKVNTYDKRFSEEGNIDKKGFYWHESIVFYHIHLPKVWFLLISGNFTHTFQCKTFHFGNAVKSHAESRHSCASRPIYKYLFRERIRKNCSVQCP